MAHPRAAWLLWANQPPGSQPSELADVADGWAVIPSRQGERQAPGDLRRRAPHHQQPHGAHGGDHPRLGGPEASLPGQPLHRLAVSAEGGSPSGSPAGSPAAGNGRTASSRTRTSGAISPSWSRSTTCAGTGSRVTPATAGTSARTSSPPWGSGGTGEGGGGVRGL